MIKEKLLHQSGLHDDCEILSMKDGDDVLGFSAVKLTNATIQILKLHIDNYNFSEKPNFEQVFILDSLIRASASYGETFGATKIETLFPDFFNFLTARGFTSNETGTFTPIETIVKYK